MSEDSQEIIDKIFGRNDHKDDAEVQVEDVSKIIKEWLDPKHINSKTRLTKNQVIAVTILQSLADTYDIKTLKRFLLQFRTAKLSEDGKSSTELENILKNRTHYEESSSLKSLSKFLE